MRLFCLFAILLISFEVVLQVNCSIEDNNIDDDDGCDVAESVKDEIASYANVTNLIIQTLTQKELKGETWRRLANFVDHFGPRLSGSSTLEKSIDFMVDLFKASSLENVHTEKVEVPHWVRGKEEANLLFPYVKNISILTLGYSIGTSNEGIEADVIAVRSFEELHQLPDEDVKGKIVVYAQPFVSYDVSVEYRTHGASEASKKGAVAALVRSITPFSLYTPHTGAQHYDSNVKPIPVASLTVEDAEQLLRYQQSNVTARIKLLITTSFDMAVSRNTIGEVTGRENPQKVVFVSGHIDSWDVGQGAVDDGGGAFISWMASSVLKHLKLTPRRTVRTILWTAEEVGIVGSIAYEKRHRAENKNIILGMESDIGTFEPLGLSFTGNKKTKCVLKEIGKLFVSINATVVVDEDSGPDLNAFIKQGVPAGGLKNKNNKYFWYHHTEADKVSAIDSDSLDKCAAYWAAFAYVVADLSFDLPRK